MPVQIFNECGTQYDYEDETKSIAEYVLSKEGRHAEIGIVLVDDTTILELNKKYLQHDYITDVISFPIDEVDGTLEGELYVCVDQAIRQAREYEVTLHHEVSRLVVHGILHLIGYNDATTQQKALMKEKEDEYLGHLKVS